MAGLIFLGLLGAWLFAAGKVASLLVGRSPSRPSRKLLRVVAFVIVAAFPFADEIVGRLQYQSLCDGEAKEWLAPSAGQVQVARSASPPFVERHGWYAIPIQEQTVVYLDAETGKPFYMAKAFHTSGGFIMRLGLNMGSSTSCWPQTRLLRDSGIEIQKLVDRARARGLGS